MTQPDSTDLYERDFFAWTQDQARRVRMLTGDNRLDVAHLAEEIEDLGKASRRALRSHVKEALKHLCKAAVVNSETLVPGLIGEVRDHVEHAQELVDESPSLREAVDLSAIWSQAVAKASKELADYGNSSLPTDVACPFNDTDLYDPDFDPWTALDRVKHAVEACTGEGR